MFGLAVLPVMAVTPELQVLAQAVAAIFLGVEVTCVLYSVLMALAWSLGSYVEAQDTLYVSIPIPVLRGPDDLDDFGLHIGVLGFHFENASRLWLLPAILGLLPLVVLYLSQFN